MMKDNNKQLKKAMQLPSVPCDNPSGVVVFDVETTGLNPDTDEILQISAIDGDGNTLLNTYVRPYVKEEWPDAAKVNGIASEMVKDAPYPHEILSIVKGIFESTELLISYNGVFDMGFLQHWGIDFSSQKHFDVMREFAPIYGEYREDYGDYKWQKLTTCASYYGYEFRAHDSLEDVKATLHCYNHIISGDVPNETTIAAMKEAERMEADPSKAKTYSSVEEMLGDLLEE